MGSLLLFCLVNGFYADSVLSWIEIGVVSLGSLWILGMRLVLALCFLVLVFSFTRGFEIQFNFLG